MTGKLVSRRFQFFPPQGLYFVINRRTVVDEPTAFAGRLLAKIDAAEAAELADMKKVFLAARRL